MVTSYGQPQIMTLAICIGYYRVIYHGIQEKESTSKDIFLIWKYNNFVKLTFGKLPSF